MEDYLILQGLNEGRLNDEGAETFSTTLQMEMLFSAGLG